MIVSYDIFDMMYYMLRPGLRLYRKKFSSAVKGVFWFAVWFSHAFSRIYCKQTTKDNDINFFPLTKAFQCLPYILFWVYCLVTCDVRMTLTGSLKNPCADDWACSGGLKQKTQLQLYLLFHWLSLSAQLVKNIAIYKYGSHFSKKSQFFHVWGAIKTKIKGLLS